MHEEYGPELLCLFRNGDKAACAKIEDMQNNYFLEYMNEDLS